MSNLATLNANIADLRDALTVEREMVAGEYADILNHIDALSEGLRELRQRVSQMHQNRHDTINAVLGDNGISMPSPGGILEG